MLSVIERMLSVIGKMRGMRRRPLNVASHVRRSAFHALAAGVAVIGIAVTMPDAEPEATMGVESSAATSEVATQTATGAATTGARLPDAETGSGEAKATVDLGSAQLIGNWAWYGYRLNWSETNQIANLSLWNAVSGVSGSRLIPYSGAIMRLYAVNWVLTARNARAMGQCLAISYAGTGLIVGC